jgi:hypothetical protein
MSKTKKIEVKMAKRRILTIDDIPLDFGKYKGLSPMQIADVDPSYIVWLYDTVKPKSCSKDLRNACEWDIREFEDEYEYGLNRDYGMDGWGHYG